jgi:hypothetical protein
MEMRNSSSLSDGLLGEVTAPSSRAMAESLSAVASILCRSVGVAYGADAIAADGREQIEGATRCRAEALLEAPTDGFAVGQQVVEVRLDGRPFARRTIGHQRQR